MIGNKKVIGVCLTKVNNRTHADYVSCLHAEALKADCRLMVFNSIIDFFNHDEYDEGAMSVYDIINYDIIDALIIFYEHFYDKALVAEIIRNAHSHNVPVVVIGAKIENCYCILPDYRNAYKDIMRHLIRDHGITDTCFFAGNKENDPESQLRIQCYKEVLEENSLPFHEDMIYYGGFWSAPTKDLAWDLHIAGIRPPRGIICANDSMAIALCEVLTEIGYRIPEDVAVVGFDGIPEGEYFYPKLTTCKEDSTLLAKLCIETLTGAWNNTLTDGVAKYQYSPSINQSCGCPANAKEHVNNIGYLFRMNRELEQHEAYIHSWLDHILASTTVNQVATLLTQCVLWGSYVCLTPHLFSSIRDNNANSSKQSLPKELVYIGQNDSRLAWDELPMISLDEIVPDLQEWACSDSVYIISSLFVGNKVCGYYAIKMNSAFEDTHKINRVVKAINLAFNSILNQFSQKFMKLSMENAAHSNPITGLPNLKGAASWFEDFSLIEKNHKRTLTVSIYSIPKYKFIYENYGIKDIEEILCTVADTLDETNPDECLITHISEDEFVTINYFDNPESAKIITNEVAQAFLSKIEQINATSGKDYYVEVNTGYTTIHPGWKGSLASYIRLATNEMYIKRIKAGMGAVVKEQNMVQDYYNSFNLLLEKNLFDYHFQPIVNARTGEIYAYEALMRPDSSIGMNPLQVLETAGVYKRLYDIEKSTIFNVMERFSKDFEKFNGHKIFINSIPGHFLNETDNETVRKLYSNYMKYVVFEITEQNSVSDEELTVIKRIGNSLADNQIAIDDYGTGHSNIVNLMRYTPQIIKIDRFLISDIHKDTNKQMFVRSTIEFARMNNIQVLAEGVELSEELRMVIELGVDYVQGYYTGRPAPDPIPFISSTIKEEIQNANYIAVIE